MALPGKMDTARFAPVRSLLERAVADGAFPGAAYGVWHRGGVVALDAAGRHTYDASSAAVTPDTIYDLASLTKVLATTAIAMLLVDRCVLDLDTPLGEVLPGFVIGKEPGSHKERVTFRMLLAHSSGLPGYAPLFETHREPRDLLRAALQVPLTAEPGTRAEYSDIGFLLLGKALEVLSGDLLSRVCRREIFAPLGMERTCYCPPKEWLPQIPPTEDDRTFRHRVIHGEVHDENCWVLGGYGGHAGLFSTAEDVLRFAACMLRVGLLPKGTALFRPETVDLFSRRQQHPAGTSRTLGWDTPGAPSSSGTQFGPRSIGHLGFTGTSLWLDPERELAVVLLTNRTWPTRENRRIQQVRPAFHDCVADCIQAHS